MYTVGCVPYLNAKPLVWAFKHAGESSPVKVLFDVPSKLPKMLDDGTASAILVSSIEALRMPGARITDGVSISSYADVMSVRIFSKVEPQEIKSLALDQSSMTSNALAQIVLAENYDVHPEVEPMPPSLPEMLKKHDAGLLIGDNGMRQPTGEYHIIDLGAEWRALTGLPFVWAVWLGRGGMTGALSGHLFAAMQEGLVRMSEIVPEAAEETSFPLEIAEHYLTNVMDFELGDDHLSGLEAFRQLLMKHKILKASQLPEVITAEWSARS
ncbi:MAG: menaquinone biosynthesis protein [Fimbriimonadaceae bacterium]|nr:menaquinone biosynthesis protein [Fimbriimonadaceae bacterium]